MLDALSLNHGEGYGRGYFTARNRQLLYNLVKGHNPSSFAELYALMPKMNSRASQDAFELVAVLQMLADYPVLQVLPSSTTGLPDSESIHMARLLEEGEIAYFWLPAAIESISVREIGKLAIFSLLSAAVARQQEGKPTVPVYLVIDEFQRIAGENFSILLEQARSFGIHLILANQTISDLNTHSKDLRPTVRTNTRTKFFFSVTEPDEIRALSSLSGEALIELSSRSVSRPADTWGGQRTETMSLSEKIIPRLTTQDIQRHSDHPEEFILHVSRGSGFSQFAGLPIAVRALRPMPRDKHDYFSAEPWPTEPFVTPPSPPPSAAPASPTQPAPAVPNVGQAAPPPPPAQPVGAPPKGQQPGTPPTGQASPPPSASSAAGQSHGPSAATGQKAHKTPAQKDEERLAEARRYFNDLIGRHIIDAGYYEIRRAEPPERDEKARTHDENVRDLFDEQGES